MPGSLLAGGARTPIGKLSGGLSSLSAATLGGHAITAALANSGITGDQVDYVIMGQVLQAGTGQITARQAAVDGGIGMNVPAITINKVCLSGLNALYMADLMIQAGEADIVVAGGMESMSNAPYLLPQARSGYRLGNSEVVDSLVHDGLWCAFDACHMGMGTEKYTASVDIDRSRQDEIALQSNERAAKAQAGGLFDEEIVPVEVPQRRGDAVIVDADEGIRGSTTMDSLGKLRPAFDKSGNITAGNASQISDGASAIVVMSQAKATELAISGLATIIGYGMVAGPDSASLLTQPSNAVKKALANAHRRLNEIELFELNEAFAAVSAASMDDLGISDDIVNVNGGAIALGHPIGMSGSRLALTLAHELRRRGGGLGAAALCGGGGQGDAILLQVNGS
ncbi:MAG: acetyl-CoA C-acyltransferase [Acidimicrobiales bacterium]